MTSTSRAPRERARARGSLTKQAVIDAAYEIADAQGIDAVTMRAVATRLATKPMSLYRHISNKDELLDALIERIYGQFELPDPEQPDWRSQLRRRATSVRHVLVAHPWALSLIETRSGPQRPVTFTHAEAVLATLVGAGCSPRIAAQSFVILDSFVYGFALQEITMATTEPANPATPNLQAALEPYPTMTSVMEAVQQVPDYDFGDEFDAGLKLVLDGIDQLRSAAFRG